MKKSKVFLTITLLLIISGTGYPESMNKSFVKIGNAINNIKMLVEKGEINSINERGQTPLHLASYFGLINIVNLLIEKGADVNAKTSDKNDTPLMYAALNNQYEVAEILIRKGAKINLKNKYNTTALSFSAPDYSTDKRLAKLLLDHGAEYEVYFAVWYGDLNLLQKIINDKNTDINSSKSSGGDSPLHKAVQYKNTEIAQILINNKANINKKNTAILAPLHAAVLNNDLKMVELLIKNGADINIKDKYGQTPLGLATKYNYKDIVDYLKKSNAHE